MALSPSLEQRGILQTTESKGRTRKLFGTYSTCGQQDFFAAIFTMNMTVALAHPVVEKIKKETTQKHPRKVNRSNALSFVSNSFVSIFIKQNIQEFLHIFEYLLQKTTEIIRPNRTNPRNHRQKTKVYE